MSMQDPIADMFTRIRNGQSSGKVRVTMPLSNVKCAIARVLKEQGYIKDFFTEDGHSGRLTIVLKYFEGRPVIELLKRESRPGLRVYRSKNNLPSVNGGLGIALISTSRGVMTDKQARAAGHGGEVLGVVF